MFQEVSKSKPDLSDPRFADLELNIAPHRPSSKSVAPLLTVPTNNPLKSNALQGPGMEPGVTVSWKKISDLTGSVDLTSDGSKIKDGKAKPSDINKKKAKLKEDAEFPLSNLIKYENNVLNIKPFLNFTANLLGINTVVSDDPELLDPTDSATVFKSIFHIWNPQVCFLSDLELL